MEIVEGYINQEATIMEMSKDGSSVEVVPVDQSLIDSLKENDKNPMFVTIEVLNERVSKNGRNWTREAILSVAEQINSKKPDAHWGHLTKEERATKNPRSETIWLGASVKEANGKVRLIAKGYVLPSAKRTREYLKTAQKVGKNVTVSVYGKVRKVVRDAKGYIDMGRSNFDLESIDYARAFSEGVKPFGKFVVTAEMTDDSNLNNDKDNEVKREEAIRSATADELKELDVVSEMIEEAVSKEKADLETVVSEMADVKSVLGLDDKSDKSAVEVIKEMVDKSRDLQLDSELRDKVESPSARKVLKQIVVSEMSEDKTVAETVDEVLASESGQAVIKEMIDNAPTVSPRIHQPATSSSRKWTKKK